jgi:tRNA(adenine34) deaminase
LRAGATASPSRRPPRARSSVAHAEINTLVQLGMGRRYFDCTLSTTLKPCAQCIGAAWLSTIGRVAFAATDVYGGASTSSR